MTAKHRSARPAPIKDRVDPPAAAKLCAHLSVVVHPDNTLSWHVGVLDRASLKMTFPLAGVADANTYSHTQPLVALSLALGEALDLALLMRS